MHLRHAIQYKALASIENYDWNITNTQIDNDNDKPHFTLS